MGLRNTRNFLRTSAIFKRIFVKLEKYFFIFLASRPLEKGEIISQDIFVTVGKSRIFIFLALSQLENFSGN